MLRAGDTPEGREVADPLLPDGPEGPLVEVLTVTFGEHVSDCRA